MKNSHVFIFSLFTFINAQSQNNKFNLLIGTYTNKCDSKGIYVYEFDTKTAEFNFLNATENVINPSYLSVSADNKVLYAVNEYGAESTISSFKFDISSAKLDLLNKQKAEGLDPCHIISDDKNVITANYSSGNISVFGKNTDGSLTEAKQLVQHYGDGLNAQRQKSPHAHMVYFSPDKNFVLATDLGNDKVYSYVYNPQATSEILKIKDTISVKAGGGPRHLTFSKDGKFVYLLQELDGKIIIYSYSDGNLKEIDAATIVSKDFKGIIGAADIHISPDGKFLYATNRGTANNISIFKILKSGTLEWLGQTSTLGKTPRNFAIDPSGNFLLVANQNSNDVVIFKRNKKTGDITDTGKKILLCSPVCLIFTVK
jgi:6-phosphogluconolactonase